MDRIVQGHRLYKLLGVHRGSFFRWVKNAGYVSPSWRNQSPTLERRWNVDTEVIPSVPTFGMALAVEVLVDGNLYLSEAQFNRLNQAGAFKKPGGDQVKVTLVPE